MARMTRSILRAKPVVNVMRYVMRAMVRLYPKLRRELLPSAASHGAVFTLDVADAQLSQSLDIIPSETTRAERRLLYSFFAKVWSGSGAVLEIGPFLGGTTRAIALGMIANPRCAPQAHLLTFDRFGSYGNPEDLIRFLRPVFDAGLLKPRDAEGIRASNSFRDVFEKIHADGPYRSRIEVVEKPVPDTAREEADNSRQWFEIPANADVTACFVDGCKSWYGTRYFMEKTVPRVKPGTPFIFQDFSQHTCFWLPAFIGVFQDAFALTFYCDSTYAFVLTRPLTVEEIRARFPETPELFGAAEFDKLFDRLVDDALRRDDERSLLMYRVQHAAALAYCGLNAKARNMLLALKDSALGAGHDELFAEALRSPTYRPGGQEVVL